jgi:hypothetical protein
MDYFSQKFSATAKIIVADLRDIANKISFLRESIEQHSKTVCTEDKGQEQDREVQPVWIKAILSKYDEAEGKRQSNDDRHYRVQNSIRWATWSAFIAATIYASIAALQWCSMQQSNKITRESLKLNQVLIKDTFAASVVAEIGFSGNDSTVNIGFPNRGKVGTTSSAVYEITLISLPEQNPIRSVGTFSVTDSVPRMGENPMPNHYYPIESFTKNDLAAYRDSREAIKISGTLGYDNGFGDKISKHFCVATTAFQSMDCDGIPRYLRSLPIKR